MGAAAAQPGQGLEWKVGQWVADKNVQKNDTTTLSSFSLRPVDHSAPHAVDKVKFVKTVKTF